MIGHTCPDINRSIEYIKGSIWEYLYALYEELKDGEVSPEEVTAKMEDIYQGAVEEHLEDIRETNSKLRDSAEKEIEQLKSEIEDLISAVNELQGEKDRLEEELENLRNLIDE